MALRLNCVCLGCRCVCGGVGMLWRELWGTYGSVCATCVDGAVGGGVACVGVGDV